MNTKHLTCFGWLFLLLALPVSMAIAQTGTTGDVAGIVKDSSDAIVARATVTLTNTDTGDTRTAVSNDSGS